MSPCRFLVTAITGLVLSVVTGCVDDNPGFYIKHMAIPGSGCEPKSESAQSSEYRPSGILDVSIGVGYWGFPVIVNTLVSSINEGLVPERNNLHMKEFKVSLDLGNIPGFSGGYVDFSEFTSGMLAPDGVLVSMVKLISDELATKLSSVVTKDRQPTIVAYLKAVAARGGSDTESSEFAFPITLCSGCLVDFRANCPDQADEEAKVLANICGLPQDEPVTCCPVTGLRFAKCFAKDVQ